MEQKAFSYLNLFEILYSEFYNTRVVYENVYFRIIVLVSIELFELAAYNNFFSPFLFRRKEEREDQF